MEFKKYKRKGFAEARPVNQTEIDGGVQYLDMYNISISETDIINDSPKDGDMIARNPKDHSDQWLISEKYFNDNFEF